MLEENIIPVKEYKFANKWDQVLLYLLLVIHMKIMEVQTADPISRIMKIECGRV